MTEQTNCVGCDEEPGLLTIKSSVLISKMFTEITDLEVKINYTICKPCQQELRSCYNFRKRCREIFTLYNSEPEEKEIYHATPLSNDPEEEEEEDQESSFTPTASEEVLVKMEETIQNEDMQWEDNLRDDTFSEDEEKEQKSEDESDEKSNTFDCDQCDKSYKFRHQLVTHQSNHKNFKMFACDKEGCSSAFNDIHRLVRHYRNVHHADETEVGALRTKVANLRPQKPMKETKVPPGKVKCEFCQKILCNQKYLKEHVELQHTKKAKFVCKYSGCEKRFVLYTLYDQHMRQHTGQSDFTCKFCSKGFMQRKIYNQHLKKSHQVSQEEIDQMNWSANGVEPGGNKCKDCGLEFTVPYQLFKHRALQHGDGKKYICDICGRFFISKPFLVSHQKYHKGIKNKKCTKCPSAFTEERGLRTHMRRVHKMTDEEIYELV